MKKLFWIFTLALAFANGLFAQTPVPGGFVSGTWTLGGSPYNVQGNIQIPDGSTLSIEPGVSVNFQGAYKLNVQGRLLAIGTITDSITFTSIDTTIGWKGIRFDETPATNDTSKIFYCKLQYCKRSSTLPEPDKYGGAFYFNNFSKAIISNNSIIKNLAFKGAGIYCKNSSPVIIHNTISYNSADTDGGGAIYCESGSSPVISFNVISYNSAIGPGALSAGISLNGNPNISNNIITYNTSEMMGGGIYCENGTSGIINNNVISYNTGSPGGGVTFMSGNFTMEYNTISNNTSTYHGGGIYCNYTTIYASNNIISNNTGNINGGGIFCTLSFSTFINNTIVNNSAANGGAIYCDQASDPGFRNCIFYGNTASTGGSQVYLNDDGSDPNFIYCDIQGGAAAIEVNGNFYTGLFQNNIDADPLFVSPSSGAGSGFDGVNADWTLQSASPCVDAGDPLFIDNLATDIAGNPRVNICRIDMGALEYQAGIPFSGTIDLIAPVSCFGYSNAVLHAVATGDSTPYSYLWSTGDTTAVADSLPAGFYSVTISNATGCERIDSITLTQPNGMYFTPYATPGTCSGVCDGSVNVHVWWGGTPPYTYLWNTTTPETTAVTTFTLCPGYYSVTITDSLGCQDTTGILLEAPSGLSLNVNVTEIICHGDNNGGFYLNATGGTGSTYQYTINGGSMWSHVNTFSSLPPGTYQIQAKDMAGCITQPQEIVLTDPPLLEAAFNITEASCYNGNNGNVNISISGGVPSYYISWNIPGQPQYFPDTNSVSANNVPVGNYSVSFIDSRGCSDTLPFTVGVSLDSPYVCIVTVDTLSWKNAVIWEKPLTAGITEYRIYKEISVNNYSQIGAIPYSDNPRFIDNGSVPESHGDKYKITAIDTCGGESVLSPYHKTMNLTIAAFGSTMGLNWDDYVDESGDFVPPTYYIYRGTSPSNMAMYDSVSGSFNSYNDLNVYSLFYYMVGVKKLSGCGNAKSPFISFSNRKDNSGMGIGSNDMLTGTILISPNPMSTSATLTIPNWHIANSQHPTVNGKLQIMDIAGKVVRTIPIPPLTPHGLSPDKPSHAQLTIERGDLKPGIYFVEFNAGRIYRGKLIVE